jgi:hypothetical protein
MTAARRQTPMRPASAPDARLRTSIDASCLYAEGMAYQRPNIADVGLEVGACLSEGDESGALRLAFRCVELIERAPVDDRQGLVAPQPVPTGDARFDALLAAITEYLCAREGLLAPTWVEDPSRFLDQWWFVSGIQSLHADAIAHSPISFARRGVFITAGALAYA